MVLSGAMEIDAVMPQSAYDRYFDNPVKYGREVFHSADMQYQQLVRYIDKAMMHMVLQSKHINMRRADPNIRSASYINILRKAIDGLVDVQADIMRRGNPIIRAVVDYPDDMPEMLRQEADKSGNRIEDYYSKVIEPRYANLHRQMEAFFYSTAQFPYGVMRGGFDEKYKEVIVGIEEEPVLDVNGLDTGMTKPKYTQKRRLKFIYPTFETLMPWECRVDLRSRNWNNDWEYFFTIDELSADQLLSFVKTHGADERAARKVVDETPTVEIIVVGPDRSSYGEYGADKSSTNDESAYKLITGYFRLFNEKTGEDETRVLRWINDADDAFAVMEEKAYERSTDEPPYMISYNNPLVGLPYGISDAELGAILQDEGNESWNIARDLARLQAAPSYLIASGAFVGADPEFLPFEKIKVKLDNRITNVNQAVSPLIAPGNINKDILLEGMAEERLNTQIGGADSIVGRSGSRDRKSQTLGQDEMRQSAALRAISRKTVRHIEELERLVNTSKDMLVDELINNYSPLDLRYTETALRNIRQPQDFLTDIYLTMPYARKVAAHEEEYAKMLGLIEQYVQLMPSIVESKPEVSLEFLRMLGELNDQVGLNEIIEKIKEGGLSTSPQQIEGAA